MTAPPRSPRDEIRGRAVHRTIPANGLEHRVLTFGAEGGRDLVFVPGITSPAETAEFIAQALPEFRFHVPDLRGRGGTGRARAGEYTLDDYAADLAAVLTALELDSPVLVGHSLGARIVARWAVSTPHDDVPLVLVDPPTSGPGRDPYPMTARSFLTQLDEARDGTTPDRIRHYFPHWPDRELLLRAEVLGDCDPTAVAESHRGFETEDFFEIWDRVDGDVVLIHGGNSPVVPQAAVDELAARNPSVPLVRVPDAGHMIPWDNLPGFVRALRSHLGSPTL